jgi:hypothetical protein
MTDPPRRPQSEQNGDPSTVGSRSGASRWGIVVGIAIAVTLIALIVLLHLTGTIGPGAH